MFLESEDAAPVGVKLNPLSHFVYLRTYARWIEEEGARETDWAQTVRRYLKWLTGRRSLPSEVVDEIESLMLGMDVLPSMRALWASGEAADRDNTTCYNCLGVETEFITSDGVRRFSDFSDGDRIKVLTHTGAWKPAVVRSYGQQQLCEIDIVRGRSAYTVRATRNHQWILDGGQRTNSVQVGQRLIRPPRIVGQWVYEDSNPEQRYYWALGYVYGDGTTVKDADGNPRSSMVRLCGHDKAKFLGRFQELGFATSSPPTFGGDAMAYTGRYLKTLPTIEQDGYDNVVAFVRGYLDADGHKNPSHDTPSYFNGIQTSSVESAEFIRSVFPAVGAYITREDDLTGQTTNYGVRPETSHFGLSLGFGRYNPSAFSVKDIRESTVETVWCLEVEDDHSFVLPNGIVTGNCSFAVVDNIRVFAEALHILMSGTGFGFSVERQFVSRLPVVQPARFEKRVIVVEDSTEGWADALYELLVALWKGYDVSYDTSKVRRRGSILKIKGGRASGPEPLEGLFDVCIKILTEARGRQLRPIEAHDIMCLIGEIVRVGGFRRAALISFSDPDDEEMRHAKDWSLGQFPEWRYMSNNSAYYDSKPSRDVFDREWAALVKSGAGERGFSIGNWIRRARRNGIVRSNPCHEIGLRARLANDPWTGEGGGGQFCNLSAAVMRSWDTLETMTAKVRAATWIGATQASFTHFPYLRPGWAELCEEDRLLGVDITGQCDNPALAHNPTVMLELNRVAREEAAKAAAWLGINHPAAITCGKPSGNTSQLVDCASGFHARYAPYYIRRVRTDAKDPLTKLLRDHGVPMKKEVGKQHLSDDECPIWVVEFPVAAPKGAMLRDAETAIQMLERYLMIMRTWCGELGHNQSITVYVKDHEWDEVGQWVWDHFDEVTGVSFLPHSNHKYELAPYEEIDEATYHELLSKFPEIDYSLLRHYEATDMGQGASELACTSGNCEI